MVTKRLQGSMHFEQRHDEWVIWVAGELDRVAAPELFDTVARCLEDTVSNVVVDLSATTFLDGGGLAALDECCRLCEESGRELTIGPLLEPGVARVLAIVGLHERIRLDPT
jgi:anti-anti-sigma factor